ncbi:MAG: hypothetical protein IKZ96_02070 [Bacilli bacterium]|nr:hypothetical protein [Bacilli bacterium]
MGNIANKDRKQLSFNAEYLVNTVEAAVNENIFPYPAYDVDASVEEIAEAMKFIIDSDLIGAYLFYARKIKVDFDDRVVDAVLFTISRDEFDTLEKKEQLKVPRCFPMVIGIKAETNNELDGNVFIKEEDELGRPLEEWKKAQEQKRMVRDFKLNNN